MTDKDKDIFQEAPIKIKDEPLKEINLSWAGKLFFAGAAAFILGKGLEKMNVPIKIKGNPEEIRAVVDAIMSSKRFQQELSRPGATIESVIEKLEIRNMTKDQFRRITGKPWPL